MIKLSAMKLLWVLLAQPLSALTLKRTPGVNFRLASFAASPQILKPAMGASAELMVSAVKAEVKMGENEWTPKVKAEVSRPCRWSQKAPHAAVLRLRGGEVGKLSSQRIKDAENMLRPGLKHWAELARKWKENTPLVGVITLDDAKYCHDDHYPNSKTRKRWMLGDSDNANSYWKNDYRCLLERAEGLTFSVVRAGLNNDDKTFKEAGVITSFTPKTEKDPALEMFINSHIELNGKSRARIGVRKDIDGKTSYEYSSELIHKGLESAVNALLDRNVTVIVGDCGFDNGIQAIVTELIAKRRPHKPCPCLMSSLTLLPTMLKMTAEKEVVLVLTSNETSFSAAFEKLTGLDESAGNLDNPNQMVSVLGFQDLEGFGLEVAQGTSVDLEKARTGIMSKIQDRMEELKAKGKKVGCILCECSELPAYSNNMRMQFKLPVFDAMTCASVVADSMKQNYAFGHA